MNQVTEVVSRHESGDLVDRCVVVLAVVLVPACCGHPVKRRIDTDKPVAVRVKRTIKVSPACIDRLRILSSEPVLVKLEEGVLRFQPTNGRWRRSLLRPAKGKGLA